MNTVVVRGLSPEQNEPWEFRLEPLAEGGGIVSVPSVQQGYPIDWPPRLASQARWLRACAPNMEACAGAAWRLKPAAWRRLLRTLAAQTAREESAD